MANGNEPIGGPPGGADPSWYQRLMAYILRTDEAPPVDPEMLGTGMAAEAGEAIQSRDYKLYAAEAQAMGETPQTYDEWMRGR